MLLILLDVPYTFLYIQFMKIINATFARNHWFSLLKSVSNGTENPTAITSKNGDCVLISMEDWDHINKRYCAVCDCEEDYEGEGYEDD